MLIIEIGSVWTLAGGWPGIYEWKDGIGHDARFDYPMGLALTSDGNKLYVSDACGIRQVDTNTGLYFASLCVLFCISSLFICLSLLALTSDGDPLYVSNSCGIRQVDTNTGFHFCTFLFLVDLSLYFFFSTFFANICVS
jgi:hypothetical protein